MKFTYSLRVLFLVAMTSPVFAQPPPVSAVTSFTSNVGSRAVSALEAQTPSPQITELANLTLASTQTTEIPQTIITDVPQTITTKLPVTLLSTPVSVSNATVAATFYASTMSVSTFFATETVLATAVLAQTVSVTNQATAVVIVPTVVVTQLETAFVNTSTTTETQIVATSTTTLYQISAGTAVVPSLGTESLTTMTSTSTIGAAATTVASSGADKSIVSFMFALTVFISAVTALY